MAQARCLQLIPINAHATGDNAQSIASNGGQKEDKRLLQRSQLHHICTHAQSCRRTLSPRVRQSSERSQRSLSRIPKDYIVWASSLVRPVYPNVGHKITADMKGREGGGSHKSKNSMPTSKDIRPHCCSHGYLVVISNIMISASSPLTGLAIGIHNFPEGLATFVATLSSPSLGVALAIAIALHNIPEGVCVAMPVYYATGSKWRGFLWAFLSGISEPFGESPVAECKSKL